MEIWFIIYTIAVLYIGAELGYYFYYSPKATVNRLLREMYKIPIKMARKQRRKESPENWYYDLCKVALKSRCKIINDLLKVESNFDQERDKEWILKSKNLAQGYLDNVETIFGQK